MDSLWFDLRSALRALRQRPGFSGLAVLTLALGIGVNTVAFSAIDALLLRPFRMASPDRVGWITFGATPTARGAAAPRDLHALTDSARTFETIIAERRLPVSLHTPAGGEQAWALAVTSDYLATLGARPVRGRLFDEKDLKASELPVVVSYRFWRDRLGAPDSLAGQRIVVNGRSFGVAGVLPDDFQGIGGLYAPDMWLALERLEVLNLPDRVLAGDGLVLFGRLRPDVTHAEANEDLRAVMAQSGGREGVPEGRSAFFHPVSVGHPELRSLAPGMWLAFGAVGIVLAIACFNVAALLMVRTAERQKEIGVKSALGATRARIVRQLVLEGLLLAAAGGAAALVVAAWSADLLATFTLPSPIPQRLQLGIDRTLVLFTVAAVTLAGVLPAILPGLQATRANLLGSMRLESVLGGRPSRIRSAFVVVQIAGSTLFVVAALLFARSFLHHVAVSPRFDVDHTIALELSPMLYGYDETRSRALVDTLRQRLAALPQVAEVAVADRVPFYVGYPNTVPYSTDGVCTGADCRRATTYRVGRGYFDALGVPLKAGRDFTDAELRAGTAVIVSERMAAEAWPAGTAVGRVLRLGDDQRRVEVIGVAADYVHRNISEPSTAYVYQPLRDSDYGSRITVVTRSRDDPRPLIAAVREQVRALDPNLPSAAIATMTERMKMPQWLPRTTAGFFLICGALALVLATVGLFGVMYFTVSQRTREFGIRAALGATRQRVVAVVLQEGLRLAAPGVLLGMTAAYIVARLLARGLYGVVPGDPVSFGGTALLQVAVALAASALPAWRATKADPIAALRQE